MRQVLARHPPESRLAFAVPASSPSAAPAPWLNWPVDEHEGQADPPYGEQVVSWVTVLSDVAPAGWWYDLWHDDLHASELHRLRGLAASQASEVEAAVKELLGLLRPELTDVRMAGRILGAVKEGLSAELGEEHAERLRLIDRAITRRNRLVHDTIEIGWSQQYGEHIPVIELLGGAEVSESSLREDIAIQQQATRAAVELLVASHESRTSPDAL